MPSLCHELGDQRVPFTSESRTLGWHWPGPGAEMLSQCDQMRQLAHSVPWDLFSSGTFWDILGHPGPFGPSTLAHGPPPTIRYSRTRQNGSPDPIFQEFLCRPPGWRVGYLAATS